MRVSPSRAQGTTGQVIRVDARSCERTKVCSAIGFPHSGHGFWSVGGSASWSNGPSCAGPM